jgi:hypothetical protein
MLLLTAALCSSQVRTNPFGTQPYPYVPQGLLVVEEIGEL